MEAVCKAALSRHRVEPSYHRTCCKNTVINEVSKKYKDQNESPSGISGSVITVLVVVIIIIHLGGLVRGQASSV